MTNGRYQVPDWNAIGEFNAAPFNNIASAIPSPPQMGVYCSQQFGMPPIPQNEEFQMQITSTGVGRKDAAIVIGSPQWSRAIPQGSDPLSQPICIRATGAIAGVANAWSGPSPITFTQSLRGGVYAVIGASSQGLLSQYFRLDFPRSVMYRGRKMRPGWVTTTAVANLEHARVQMDRFHLGVWGYFHTFELPQMEVFNNATGAATQEIRLWLVYMGQPLSLLDQLVASFPV
jgi:hypothetical protein